MTVTVAKRKA